MKMPETAATARLSTRAAALPAKLWANPWPVAAVLFAADIGTTLYAVNNGYAEANPLAALIGLGAFLGLKLIASAILCIRWRKLGAIHWRNRDRIIVLGLLAAIVVWNTVILMRGQ